MAKVRTRFAPSPTGYMHIGNLRTALYEYLIAKHDHGDFILRIEDTDQEREVEGAVDMIYKVMDQTGLGYDEGPNKPGEVGPYVQSERLAIYKEYADKLVELGGAHYCFCDEETINKAKEESDNEELGYIDPCKHLSLEEAKQRDHRKLGKDLELFMTHKLVGSGLPMYLPNGATVRRLLERYIQDKEIRMGYKHVYTPSLANVELYKTSGHWDHYKEDMFPVMKMDNEELVLRPMNCPHHMLIFKSKMRSYKDLPIRIGELAHDFRYEDSGTVCGIERVREMCQNDAHLFVRPDQIKDEVGKVVKLILDVYKDFGFKDYKFRLSLRDKNDKHKYFDDDEMWDKAESQLREILTELGLDFYEAEGEAAFYGPKLDVQLKSAIGHDVTVSTCQLDFLLPQRFELEYIGEDGKAHRPVVIHRAILGTLDRFMAFLIEETKGAFPTWLAPVQVKVLPISDKHLEYANKVKEALQDKEVRVEVDDRAEKIGYKIREAQLQKVPYMLVVGDKEQEAGEVGVRNRKDGDVGAMKLEDFVEKIDEEIKTFAK